MASSVRRLLPMAVGGSSGNLAQIPRNRLVSVRGRGRKIELRTMHLFAGAGGGLLADLILGHQPVVAVEWEPYACQVLRERAAEGWFPCLRVWEGDVRLFDPSEYAGSVDCIHAGFPCQDVSNAGGKAGVEEGTRSGLYRELLRIVRMVRPRFFYMENVSALLHNGMGTVVADVAALGYGIRWCCIQASDVGAPHERERWFALAYADDMRELQPQRIEQVKRGRIGHGLEETADAVRKGLAGHRNESVREKQEQPAAGGSCWWATEPGLVRMVHGLPHRVHRIKALGNAQVPLQAAVAWKLLGGD